MTQDLPVKIIARETDRKRNGRDGGVSVLDEEVYEILADLVAG